MAEFITKCPHCDAELQAQDEWIGMEVECPQCQKTFVISEYKKVIEPNGEKTILESIIGNFIEWCRNVNWVALDKNLRKIFITIGSIIFIVLGLTYCIGGVVLTAKSENAIFSGIGICIFLACIFMTYLGEQLFKLGDKLIKKNKNLISSSGLLNCIYIFFFFIAIGLTIVGIYLAYKSKNIQIFYSCLIGAFSSFLMSIVTLKPQLINLHIDEKSSSDEDWISLLILLTKGNLFMIPYYWCVSLVALCINLIVRLGAEVDILLLNWTNSITPMILIGISPLSAYLLFLGVNFTLNISRAILSIPQKLDAFKEEKN